MPQKKQSQKWKHLLNLAGVPGLLLLFYPVMMFLIARRRDTVGAYATVDASASIMILFSFVAFAVGAYYLFARPKARIGRKILCSGPILALLIYHVWAWCTCLWSVDFKLSFFRAFECISFMLLIVAVFQELRKRATEEEMIDWSMLFITVNICSNLLLKLRMGAGITPYATQYESTLFFFMALLYCKNYFQKYLTITFALLSMSTAGYAAMAGGSLFVMGGKNRNFVPYLLIFVLAGVVFSFVDYKDVLRVTVFRNHPEIVEKWDFASNSSGRNTIHEIAFKAFKEHPVEGWGFVACEPYISHKVAWGAGLISFHSGYLSALVGAGLVGLSFFVLFLFALSIKVMSKRIPNVYRPLVRSTFVVILAHTLSNPGIGTRVTGSWLPAFYLVALISTLALPRNTEQTLRLR